MDVSSRSAGALLLGTLIIATLHALIPSHWLAFAVVGRAQRWTLRQTMRVTLLAGIGHLLMTICLGVALASVGSVAWKNIPESVEHTVTAVVLIVLGLYFAWPNLRGSGGCHHPHGHDYHLEDSSVPETVAQTVPQTVPPMPGRLHRIGAAQTVTGTLVMGMTLSPCLDLLSIYVAASTMSRMTLVLVSLIMVVVTLGLMTLLVWLTLRGLEKLNLRWLEQNEGLAVGGVLVVLGIILFFV